MGILVIGGILIGSILGRFFKVLILVPVCGAVIFLMAVSPVPFAPGLLATLLLVVSLQLGYLAGVASRSLPAFLPNTRKAWAPNASRASRPTI
jgi:hypothetical protein